MYRKKIIANYLYIVLLVAGALSCDTILKKEQQKQEHKNPIARTYNKYLYPSDLKGVISAKLSPEDSAVKASNYIDLWINNQLMLQKAEVNLKDDMKNVEQLIEDYRASLLIYRYKQKFIEQKLDTIIKENQVQEYYNTNANEFLLDKNLIKGTYYKFPANAPGSFKVRWWCVSKNPMDAEKLADYSNEFAIVKNSFQNKWMSFDELLGKLPFEVENQEYFLKRQDLLESKDSAFNYYMKISDYKLVNDTIPLSLVRSKIKSILLAKKKIQLINDLQRDAFHEALNNGEIEIYSQE